MKIWHILLLAFATIFISACAHSPKPGQMAKTPKPFDLEFVVQGGMTLKVVTPAQGCSKKDDGCVRVNYENKGEITFKFKNAQPLPCADHPNSWILSKIELSDFPKSFPGPVSPQIAADFGADRATGLVWEKSDGEELVSKTIIDENRNRLVAYYQVTVESCDPDKAPVSLDPRIENDGDSIDMGI